MSNPTEFKAIKELRQIGDGDISGDLLMLIEGQQESLKVLLSQIVNHIQGPILDIVDPPGVIKYWPGDTPPSDKWVFVNDGFDFDTDQYPLLAKAWPTGRIPPHKGLVVECTADGAVTGATEKGQVISHDHGAEIRDSEVEVSVTIGDAGNHDHGTGTDKSPWGQYSSQGHSVGGAAQQSNANTSTDGLHKHPANAYAKPHKHNAVIGKTGETRNTVDRINYNAMVRLG